MGLLLIFYRYFSRDSGKFLPEKKEIVSWERLFYDGEIRCVNYVKNTGMETVGI